MQKIAKHHHLVSWSNLPRVKTPLFELFVGGIKEAYWAENHLVRMLLKMTNATTPGNLYNLLDHHVDRTKAHVTKLEHIFELLDEIIEARKSDAMAGLAVEIGETIEYTEDGSATREVGIILVVQKIKQVEIATYSGLMKLAVILGREDVADVLSEILNDETEFNELLVNHGEIISQRAVEET